MARERESVTTASGTGADARDGNGVREAVRSAEDRVKERAHQVKERVHDRKEELRSEAAHRAERWTSSLGEHVERVARALRAAGDALEVEGEDRMSAVSLSVAEQVDRMGEYLRREDPGAMLHDLEDLARRNPGAFVGTTFVSGLLLGRFLRSSEPAGNGDAAENRERWTGSIEAEGTFAAHDGERPGTPGPSGGGATVERSGGWGGEP
jgi:hypothetical protein